MDVEFDDDPLSVWDVRVFERKTGNSFELCHERIVELGVPLAQVKAALEGNFELLEETDPDGEAPTDESVRAYFAFRRKS